MDETGNPTTRGYVRSEPITLEVTMDHIDALDAWHEMVDQPTVEIDVEQGDGAGPVTFRGALVEADGLTWWERKIRDLEANGRGKPLDAAG